MKVIRYTLNEDGTIPDYVIDGGYFSNNNENNSPQDYDLIGISETNIGLEEYTIKAELDTYVRTFRANSYELDGITYFLATEIDAIWDKGQ